MASIEPTGDNRRIGAVRKRSQRKGKVVGIGLFAGSLVVWLGLALAYYGGL